MKGFESNTFKKIGLGLIQLSLLASAVAVGVNSTAFGKSLSCQKSKACNNTCSDLKLDSPNLNSSINKGLSFKVYKELEGNLLYVFSIVSLKGHLSLFSGVSPPTT
jgi:hypothetical protein